jgi:hypothetical protein
MRRAAAIAELEVRAPPVRLPLGGAIVMRASASSTSPTPVTRPASASSAELTAAGAIRASASLT